MHMLLYVLFIVNSFIISVQACQPDNIVSLDHVPWYGVVNKKDLGVSAALSATFYGGSFLIKEGRLRTAIQGAALLFPLMRLLSTTRIVKKTLNSIPLVNYAIGCSNVECQGICDTCAIKHVLTEIMGIALLSFTPEMDTLIKKISDQGEVIVTPIECDICCEERLQKDCEWLQCCKDKIMCRECIKTYYNHNKHKDIVECPFCRQPFSCNISDEAEKSQEKKHSRIDVSLAFLLASYCALPSHNSIPLGNYFFECENKAWHSICGHCKLRNAQKGTAVFIGALLVYSYIFGDL